MQMKRKAIFLCLLILAVAVFATACGEPNPYDVNNSKNYNLSIKFDANGGFFATGTSVIVDSYNISEMQKNPEGKVEIPLLKTDDPNRGNDTFTPSLSGCFLVGWYAERTETKDAAGNVTYTYAKPWDFENDRFVADPNASYDAHKPALTLYAAWAPLYEIEYIDRSSGAVLDTVSYDPTVDTDFLTLPVWNEKTGAMNMNKFPKKDGYTFEAAYYDEAGTKPVDTETLVHHGTIDSESAVVTNSKMQVYLDWKAGEWFRISTADQFVKNFIPSGNYEIVADLDFTDKIWPTAAIHGEFTGTIQGNNHILSNISFRQNDNSQLNVGMFGKISAEASIADVTLQNITFTIVKGSRYSGTSYGLLAGTVADNSALQNVKVESGCILIDSDCRFADKNYTIGRITGKSDAGLDFSGITCETTGDDPDKCQITVTENAVKVELRENAEQLPNISEETPEVPEETGENTDATPETGDTPDGTL